MRTPFRRREPRVWLERVRTTRRAHQVAGARRKLHRGAFPGCRRWGLGRWGTGLPSQRSSARRLPRRRRRLPRSRRKLGMSRKRRRRWGGRAVTSREVRGSLKATVSRLKVFTSQHRPPPRPENVKDRAVETAAGRGGSWRKPTETPLLAVLLVSLNKRSRRGNNETGNFWRRHEYILDTRCSSRNRT